MLFGLTEKVARFQFVLDVSCIRVLAAITSGPSYNLYVQKTLSDDVCVMPLTLPRANATLFELGGEICPTLDIQIYRFVRLCNGMFPVKFLPL